jgi:hypothetical protein
MYKLIAGIVLLGLLAGCGAAPMVTSLTPQSSPLAASATQEEVRAQQNVRKHAESRHPGLMVTSLVAKRDPDTGVDYFSIRGVGTYKGQHVAIHGAYILSQDRVSALYLLDDAGNSVIR